MTGQPLKSLKNIFSYDSYRPQQQEIIEGLSGRFTTIPDVHYGEGSHFVVGDRGVSEWTLTGTTTAGVRLEVRGCDIWTFRGDEVVLKNSYWKIVER